jgi:hypothetical protein
MKDSGERSGSPLFHRVNFLDEMKDVGGHDEQVADGIGGWIPVGMRSSSRDKYACTGVSLDFVFADEPSEYLPGPTRPRHHDGGRAEERSNAGAPEGRRGLSIPQPQESHSADR